MNSRNRILTAGLALVFAGFYGSMNASTAAELVSVGSKVEIVGAIRLCILDNRDAALGVDFAVVVPNGLASCSPVSAVCIP